MGRFLKGTFFIILLLFLTTFSVENNQPVQLKYYFNIQLTEIPLYAVVYVLLILGIIIGLLMGVSKRFSQSRSTRALQRENSDLKLKIRDLEEKKLEAPAETTTISTTNESS